MMYEFLHTIEPQANQNCVIWHIIWYGVWILASYTLLIDDTRDYHGIDTSYSMYDYLTLYDYLFFWIPTHFWSTIDEFLHTIEF